jgi:hypothetical protein
MSDTNATLQVFRCPECNKTQFSTAFLEVEAGTQPELRQKLIDKHLNTFCCEGCGHRGFIPVVFVYRNDRLGYRMVCLPESLLLQANFYDQFTPDGAPSAHSAWNEAGKLKADLRVFSMEELARQVRFREKLVKHHNTPRKIKPPTPKPTEFKCSIRVTTPIQVPEKPKATSTSSGPVMQYRKRKTDVLNKLAKEFVTNRDYTGEEVLDTIRTSLRRLNQSLLSSPAYAPDHMRLGLIELGLMRRDPAGTRYWKV